VFRLSLRHFRTFGDLLLDKYLAWVSVPDMPVMSPAVGQRLLRLVRERQGCLVLGSHFGNLEYSRAVAARHPELVINVLTYDRHATKFARLMADSGPASRLHLIQVTELDLARALELRERVRQGEWVFIAGDRVPVGDSFRVFRAPFMGEDACFPIGPIVLATLLECPVYLLYCYRLDDHYHLGFERFAERIELPRNDRDRAIGEYVRAYANALEAQVALAPLQWFNFFDFWKAHDG
jgi:predicted LPLAT superfamily acyltransferase